MKFTTKSILTILQNRWRFRLILLLDSILFFFILLTFFYQAYLIATTLHTMYHLAAPFAASSHPVTQSEPVIHVSNWRLFSESRMPFTPATPSPALILRGIILGSTLYDNHAIIASSDTEESLYKTGDKLSDGTVIVRILTDRVILSRKGTFVTLTIDRDKENRINEEENTSPANLGKPFSLMKE